MLIQILLYILTVEWSTGLVSISIFYLSNYFYLPIFLLSIIFIRFVLPNACIICVCLRPSPLIRLLCFYLLALHALYYSFYFTITTWTVNFVKILFWIFIFFGFISSFRQICFERLFLKSEDILYKIEQICCLH